MLSKIKFKTFIQLLNDDMADGNWKCGISDAKVGLKYTKAGTKQYHTFQKFYFWTLCGYSEALFAKGDFIKACQEAKKALNQPVADHIPVFEDLLGTSYFNAGEHDLGIQWLHKSIHDDPSNLNAWKNLAVCYYDLEENNKSIKSCKQSYKYNGNTNSGIMSCLGDSARDLNKLNTALHYYSLAVRYKGNDKEYNSYLYNAMGRTYFLENDYHQALKYYKKAIKFNDKSVRINCGLGHVYFCLSNINKAKYYYRQAIKYHPNYSYAYEYLSYCYVYNKDYQTAIKYLHQALYKYSKNSNACMALARVYCKEHKLESALLTLKAGYQKIDPTADDVKSIHGTFLGKMGQISLLLGKTKESVSYYQKAIKYLPHNDMFHENICLPLFELHNYADITQNYSQVNPKNMQGNDYSLWGRAYYNLKKYDLAKLAFKSAIHKDSHCAKYYGNLGEVNDKLGHKKLALKNYQSALKYNSINSFYQHKVSELQTQLSNSDSDQSK